MHAGNHTPLVAAPPQDQTPLGAGTPREQWPPPLGAGIPQQTATVADGMHPTGMHSRCKTKQMERITPYLLVLCVYQRSFPRRNSTKSKLQFPVPVTNEPQKAEFTTGPRNTTTRSDTSGLSDEYALFLDPL